MDLNRRAETDHLKTKSIGVRAELGRKVGQKQPWNTPYNAEKCVNLS